MALYICQNSSNCTFKMGAFDVCKLYLNKVDFKSKKKKKLSSRDRSSTSSFSKACFLQPHLPPKNHQSHHCSIIGHGVTWPLATSLTLFAWLVLQLHVCSCLQAFALLFFLEDSLPSNIHLGICSKYQLQQDAIPGNLSKTAPLYFSLSIP